MGKPIRSICVTALALALLLVGCSGPLPSISQRPEPTPAPDTIVSDPTVTSTPAPTPEPATVTAYVKQEPIRAVYRTLSRGDIVTLSGTEGDYYIVQGEGTDRYYVDKRFIRTNEPRMSGETALYISADAPVYTTAYLDKEPIALLPLNSQFIVSDELNGVAYGSFQLDSGGSRQGYIDRANLSEKKWSLWQDCDGYIVVDKVGIYDNPDLSGTPIAETVVKVHVHVYEQVGNALRIKVIDTTVPTYNIEGYIPVEAFSDETPDFGMAYYGISEEGGGSSGGGGGGGSSGGDGSSGGGGGGPLYGGDINLGYHVTEEPRLILLSSETMLTQAGTIGTSFSDGVELIVAFYEKDAPVSLIAKDNDKYWTVLANHKTCQIPAGSVRLEGEIEEDVASPLDLQGFIKNDRIGIYDNPELAGEPVEIAVIRLQVHVIEQIKDAYKIEVTDTSVPIHGVTGYISIDDFSEEWPSMNWGPYDGNFDFSGGGSSGGGGGGSSGGGGGGGSGSSGGSEWSVPVM